MCFPNGRPLCGFQKHTPVLQRLTWLIWRLYKCSQTRIQIITMLSLLEEAFQDSLPLVNCVCWGTVYFYWKRAIALEDAPGLTIGWALNWKWAARMCIGISPMSGRKSLVTGSKLFQRRKQSECIGLRTVKWFLA